jgi:hypothetical protein
MKISDSTFNTLENKIRANQAQAFMTQLKSAITQNDIVGSAF